MDRMQVADNEYPLRGLSRPFWHSANGLRAYAITGLVQSRMARLKGASSTGLEVKPRRTHAKGGSPRQCGRRDFALAEAGMKKAPRDGPTAGPAPRRPSTGSDGRA
jgi:hypothetical protein